MFKCCCCENEEIALVSPDEEAITNNNYDLIGYLNSKFAHYAAKESGSGYITFSRKISPENKEELRLVGWKFHITIPPDQVHEAAVIISDIVVREGIRELKFYTPQSLDFGYQKYLNSDCDIGKKMTKQEFKSRFDLKEFTLYFFQHPDKNWYDIIRETEARLFSKGIISKAFVPPACKRIPGCQYFSCRCDQRNVPDELCYWDGSVKGKVDEKLMMEIYISEEDASREFEQQAYNPYNHPVPEFIQRFEADLQHSSNSTFATATGEVHKLT